MCFHPIKVCQDRPIICNQNICMFQIPVSDMVFPHFIEQLFNLLDYNWVLFFGNITVLAPVLLTTTLLSCPRVVLNSIVPASCYDARTALTNLTNCCPVLSCLVGPGCVFFVALGPVTWKPPFEKPLNPLTSHLYPPPSTLYPLTPNLYPLPLTTPSL